MALISKDSIDGKFYKELFAQLVDLQSGLSKSQAKGFLASLLTETEQVMLTKRCSAIIMLQNGYSHYRIWTILKLSSSTVARLNMNLEAGLYDDLLKVVSPKFRSKREKEEFVETLEKILRLGMPEMGKGRWKSL